MNSSGKVQFTRVWRQSSTILECQILTRVPHPRKCIESCRKLLAYVMSYRFQWKIQFMNIHHPPESYKWGQVQASGSVEIRQPKSEDLCIGLHWRTISASSVSHYYSYCIRVRPSQFRLCVLVYRCLQGTAPSYIGETLQLVSDCLLYTSPSPRDRTRSRMPSSA